MGPGSRFALLSDVVKGFRQTRAAFLVLALGLAISFAAWRFTDERVGAEAVSEFQQKAARAVEAVDRRIQENINLLVGLKGLFNASDQVTREEFRLFLSGFKIERRYSGVRVVSYSHRVTLAEKAAFEQRVRRDTSVSPRGYPDFSIKPPGERGEYMVIEYLEPMAGNEIALGLDLVADPVRVADVARARDSGEPVASGPLVATVDPNQISFAVRTAIYRRGMPVKTVAQRRAAFQGVVAVVIHVDELMGSLLGTQLGSDFDLMVHDAGLSTADPLLPPSKDNLLFDSRWASGAEPKQARHGVTHAALIDIGGRKWGLAFTPPARVDSVERALPRVVLAGGLVTSLLLFWLVWTLSVSRARALQLAEQATAVRATEGLREQLAFIQQLIEAVPQPIFFKDAEGRNLGVNKAWEQLFGIPREQAVGKTVLELYLDNPEVAKKNRAIDLELLSQPGSQSYEAAIVAADGKVHHTIYNKATFNKPDGTVAGLIGAITDVTVLKEAEAAFNVMAEALETNRASLERRAAQLGALNQIALAINSSLQLHDILNEIMRCGIALTGSKAACIAFYDEAARRFTNWVTQGLSEHFVRNMSFRPGGLADEAFSSGSYVLSNDWPETKHKLSKLAHEEGLKSFICLPLMSRDSRLGVIYFYRADRDTFTPGEVELLTTFASLAAQAIENARLYARTQEQARTDALTGLPNRVVLHDRIGQAIAQAQRNGRVFALLFTDLDRFKNVNDSLGHQVGDCLLRTVADRLAACTRKTDTVARVGGDEFVVVLTDLRQAEDARHAAQKVLEVLSQPFRIGSHELRITPSVGICAYPHDGEDVETLMRNADTAMYHAKEMGRNNYQFFTQQMNIAAQQRLQVENDLRHALERGEFDLHYQPQIDLRTGGIVGFEALARWQRPDRGMVPPSEFIPVAEEAGLITPIGEWVLRRACTDARTWQDLGYPELRVAVNCSARQFQRGAIEETVARVLDQSGLPPSSLELEITESVIMQQTEQVIVRFRALDEMGVRVAIDDFGTGYSSLSYLKRFAIRRLKIDKTFVRDIDSDPNDAAIVSAIIAMAHSLGLKVVAEGVETAGQLAFLKLLGCDGAQGYFFSKPVPGAEIGALLRDWKPEVRLVGA